MHQVSIELPGSIDQLRGIRMLSTPYGEATGDLMEPQRLTIHTPDGWSTTLIGRSSSVSTLRGRVNYLYVRRPLQPVRFLEAKADFLHTLSQLGIEPDPQMQDQMSSWTEDVPGNGERRGVIPYDWKTGIRTQFHGLVLDVQISPDPNHGWYYLLTLSAVTPDSIPTIAPAKQPTALHSTETTHTAAKLTGVPSDVRGAEVHVPSKGMAEVDLLRPQNLALTLPDGRLASVAARSSNILFFDGIAQGIYIRRPLSEVTFKEARADLIRTLADLKIEPDQTMQSAISAWPDDVTEERRPAPGLRNYQASLKSQIHGANLTLRLCPDPHGGWYYLMIFSVRVR